MSAASLLRLSPLSQESSSDSHPHLFFAKVVDLAAGVDEALRETRYLVLAHTQDQASDLIRDARMSECSIEIEVQDASMDDATQLFGLQYGTARCIWPREEAPPKPANDYFFVDEPRNEMDVLVLGLMRGGEQHVTRLLDLLKSPARSSSEKTSRP